MILAFLGFPQLRPPGRPPWPETARWRKPALSPSLIVSFFRVLDTFSLSFLDDAICPVSQALGRRSTRTGLM